MTNANNSSVASSLASEVNCEMASALTKISSEILDPKNLVRNLKAEIEKIQTAAMDEKTARNVISSRYMQINRLIFSSATILVNQMSLKKVIDGL